MDAFTPYLAEIHRQQLLGEAEARRLAKSVGTEAGVPAWRRSLGSLLASAAGTLDPSIDSKTARRTAGSGRSAGVRAMAS